MFKFYAIEKLATVHKYAAVIVEFEPGEQTRYDVLYPLGDTVVAAQETLFKAGGEAAQACGPYGLILNAAAKAYKQHQAKKEGKRPTFPVVCLCGSIKFKEDFFRAAEQLTLEGNIVLSPGLFSQADGKALSHETTTMLDDIIRQKIDMADSVYVINRDDYIGESTKAEIEYAETKDKLVRYMYPHTESH